MTESASTGVGVYGTGTSLPAKRIDSTDISNQLGLDPSWVANRVGILERRYAGDGETSADLAVGAARRALDAAGLAAEEMDAVVVTTSTADRPIPATAARVQGVIGASSAVAFDVNAACAGFLVSLDLAHGQIAEGRWARALVIGSDTYSRYLDPNDRRTLPLFGDGAGAVVLGSVPAGTGILAHGNMTDGKLEHYVSGGPRIPDAETSPEPGEHFLHMQGRDVAMLIRSEFPRLVSEALKEVDADADEVDHVFCHQANPVLIKECAAAVGFAPDQLVTTGDYVGNTGAASVPIGLDTAVRDGRVRIGDLCLMIAFGAGMTWGWSIMRWTGPVNGAPA